MKKRTRKFISTLLVVVISIGSWELAKKQYKYIKSIYEYSKIQKESASVQPQDLQYSSYDWISITNTHINYPVMHSTDNSYYMNHNYKGDEDIAGAIFYDANDEPFNGSMTILYGHSMKNGTMFNNLHYFRKDYTKFQSSKLTITTKDGVKTYKPLALYTTNNNFFYKGLDHLPTAELMPYIEQNTDYFIRDNYKYDKHIILLYTCSYNIKDGRLICFFIEE